ncbi:extracellular catalytic domain type 1 short-chain-length polyhydroxyalkanoate depolymerase [Actinokineospora sp. 24-640]
MKQLWAALAAGATAALTAAALVVAAPGAQAAALVEVTGFGANPSNLRMHLYVPDSVRQRPAVLVASHYCTGTGPAFHSGTEFARLADQHGFIVIYPSANRSGNCFDVSSQATLTHNGGGDSLGIVSMVKHVISTRGADPARVYATGVSSGAMMTNVLLGAYPEVFAAGAAFAGVPFGCFATTDGSSWNSQCANGQLIRTAQQWGDLVRGAYPGYSGPRPRMQVWHGTADDTLRHPNLGEEVKQWTNVHGLSQTPTSTDHPQANWTRTRYSDKVEAISMQGTGHNLLSNGMALMALQFLGLTSTPPTSTTSTTTTGPTTTTTPPPSGCRITYTTNTWNNGLTATVTIATTAQVNGWTLAFTLPSGQTITSGWNATYTPTSGPVQARNVQWNATIPANGSVSVGFQATHNGNTAKPTSFTLNGTPCS